jgi:hypothetical protein
LEYAPTSYLVGVSLDRRIFEPLVDKLKDGFMPA